MDKNDYPIIEEYLHGRLTEAEKVSFRQRMDQDSLLREAYTLRKSMFISLKRNQNQNNLQAKLDKLNEDFFTVEQAEPKVIPLYRNRFVMGILTAAAIALLLIIWNPFQSPSLYQQYASHQPISLTEKSTTATSAASAEIQFNEGNYKQAYISLQSYLAANSENNKARLALGISALETGKTTEVIQIFEGIHNGTSPSFKPYGTWYLALAYLKQNNITKAKEYLALIPSSEKKLFEKANKLLEELP